MSGHSSVIIEKNGEFSGVVRPVHDGVNDSEAMFQCHP